jgi:hypothetical protein
LRALRSRRQLCCGRRELAQRELSESRDQLAATSEMLRVISNSPGELVPIFDAIFTKAVRICEASFGNLLLSEGSAFRVAAMHALRCRGTICGAETR